MKILQVNCVYKTGSTGKIVYEIHKQLKNCGDSSIVCYGRGEKVSEDNVYKLCSEWYAKGNKAFSFLNGMMYGGCLYSTLHLIICIKREKPDIVHLHCLNGNFVNIYRLVSYLKANHIKTVLTLHAEFMYTANCGYALDCDRWKSGCGSCPRLRQETGSLLLDGTHRSWEWMRSAFSGFDQGLIIASVSPWLRGRAATSPIMGKLRHEVVLNGLDCSVFHPYPKEELRARHRIGNAKVIFHATPKFDDDPNNIKGGRYILRLAERMKHENIRFIVAGRYDMDIKVPENVILLGRVEDQVRLAEYYSMADLTLLTSKKETFSMVVAESLCCGTPVAGFEAGAPEQIAITAYSSFCKYADMDALDASVCEMLNTSWDAQIISEAAHQQYSNKTMCDHYYAIYRRLLNESK